MRRRWLPLVVAATLVGAGAAVVPSAAVPGSFTVAKHREPPTIPPGDYKAERLRIVSIVPSGGSTAATSVSSRLLWFGTALASGKWYAAMDKAYDLGGTTGLSTGYRANVGGLGAHPTNQQISTFINNTANARKLKKAPKIKTIWLVYFHCTNAADTASGAVCGSADHESPTLPGGATNHVFGPLDSLGLVLVNSSQWNDTSGHHSLATRNASHEVIEAATDRGGTGYHLKDTMPLQPWLGGSPWTEVQASGGTEVGDQGRVYGQLVRINYTNTATPAHSYGYDYARIFTKSAAHAGGDFSRPQSPVPYYSVTAAKNWYPLATAPGSFVEVTVKGWSVQKEKSWTLTASVLSSDPAGAKSPCLATKSRLRGPTGTNYSALSASHPTGPVMNNRSLAYLDVAFDASSTGHWCVIELKSHRTGKEKGGTGHTDAGGDLYRSWIVGFYHP